MGRIYFKINPKTRRILEKEAKRRYGRTKGFMVKTASEIVLWYIHHLEREKRQARHAERIKRNFEKQFGFTPAKNSISLSSTLVKI